MQSKLYSIFMNRSKQIINLRHNRSPTTKNSAEKYIHRLRNQSEYDIRSRSKENSYTMNFSGFQGRNKQKSNEKLFLPSTQGCQNREKATFIKNIPLHLEKKSYLLSPSRKILQKISPLKNYPHQKQSIVPKIQALPLPQTVKYMNDPQLLRRIKILENRISELHQQKQIFSMRTHSQKVNLFRQNCQLRQKLAQLEERTKNQILSLQHQKLKKSQSKNQYIEQIAHMETDKPTQTKIEAFEQLFQNFSLQCDEMQIRISQQARPGIFVSMEELPQCEKQQVENLLKKIIILQEQNRNMKAQFLNQTLEIQKNHSTIIAEYENKIRKIQQSHSKSKQQIIAHYEFLLKQKLKNLKEMENLNIEAMIKQETQSLQKQILRTSYCQHKNYDVTIIKDKETEIQFSNSSDVNNLIEEKKGVEPIFTNSSNTDALSTDQNASSKIVINLANID